MRLQPASAAAHYQLALLLATNNRLPDAIPEFQAAVDCESWSAQLNEPLRIQPDYPGVRQTLSQIASRSRR